MKRKPDWSLIAKLTICVLFGLFIICWMALELYCGFHYANTPVEDLPTWVAWILLK